MKNKAILLIAGLIFILAIMPQISATAWNASFSQDLIAYWDFNSTNDIYQGRYNLSVVTGATVNYDDGQIKNCMNNTGTAGVFANITGFTNQAIGSASGFTVNQWLKTSYDQSTYRSSITLGNGTAYFRAIYVSAKPYLSYAGAGESTADMDCGASCAGINDGNWHMYTYRQNATATTIFVDGVYKISWANNNVKIILNNNWKNTIGSEEPGSGAREWIGQIDETFISNRSFSQNEITALATGMTFDPGTPAESASSIAVTQQAPVAGYNFTASTLTITANITTTNVNVTNATLYIYNGGITTIYNGTVTSNDSSSQVTLVTFLKTGITDGAYNWSVYACGINKTGSPCAWSANRTFRRDTTGPIFDIILPIGQHNSFNASINYTKTDAGVGQGATWYNIDNGANTTITGNTNFNYSGFGNHTFYIFGNDSLGNIGYNSSTFWRHDSTVTINILSYLNALLSSAKTSISSLGLTSTSNPTTYTMSQLTNGSTSSSIIITAEDLNNMHVTGAYTRTVNDTISEINITMTPHKLILNFTHIGGPTNVSGYISDMDMTNTSFSDTMIFIKDILANGMVYIRFLNQEYNATINNTWSDKVQYYEFINDEQTTVQESIEIFETVDTLSYIQVQNNGGDLIPGATIRLYGVIPSNETGVETYTKFYGQRISDDDGRTLFGFNEEAELILVTTKEGYGTSTIRMTASEAAGGTYASPKVIRLTQSTISNITDIRIYGLYKVNGSLAYYSRFNDASKTYLMFIEDDQHRTLTYTTTLKIVPETIEYNSLKQRYDAINLIPGTHYSGTGDFNVSIFTEGELKNIITIKYYNETTTTLFDLGTKKSSTAAKTAGFFLLIAISIAMGLLFIQQGDSGVHTFMIGSIALPMFVDGMGWLAVIGGYYYLATLIKWWISE